MTVSTPAAPRQSLGLIAVVVRDYDEAIRYYVDTLGFVLVEDKPVPEQSKRWVVVAPPRSRGTQVLLARGVGDEQCSRIGNQTGGRVFLFLYTDDFARDHALYRGRGVTFVREPKKEPYGTVAVFRDLYGNLWDLVEPGASAPAAPAEAVVREYWRLMASNDFDAVAAVLAADFVLEWPQSRERIRGADRYARMNREYPAHGPWRFTLHKLVADGDDVVTDVEISDGVQHARALSFFSVDGPRVRRLVEYWPEPYAAPAWRAHLVEPLE